MPRTVNFDGGYGRVGYAFGKADGWCTVCDATHVPVVVSDASEDEYCSFSICLPCFTALLADPVPNAANDSEG